MANTQRLAVSASDHSLAQTCLDLWPIGSTAVTGQLWAESVPQLRCERQRCRLLLVWTAIDSIESWVLSLLCLLCLSRVALGRAWVEHSSLELCLRFSLQKVFWVHSLVSAELDNWMSHQWLNDLEIPRGKDRPTTGSGYGCGTLWTTDSEQAVNRLWTGAATSLPTDQKCHWIGVSAPSVEHKLP